MLCCAQARIHPEQRGTDLSGEQLEALRAALLEVPAAAVAVDADSSRFPKDWIFHHRWEEKKSPSGVSFLKIGGRVRHPLQDPRVLGPLPSEFSLCPKP